MLAGEHTRAYLTSNRERRAVCDLCRTRAQQAGWVRADRAPQLPAQEPEERPRWRIRLSRRRRPESREAPAQDGGREEGGGRTRRRRRASESPERRIRRAVDRFNDSEHRRTVEGLTRSLGRPRVAAVTPAEAPEQVRLTVAWDLSWYQWKVEFSGGDAAVRSFRNGKEVSELGAADRAWNARAGEDGRIQLRLGSNSDGEVAAPDESA